MGDANLVFDIGSNNGDDAEAYLKRGCKVIAVEANPDLCLGLHQRFVSEIASGQMCGRQSHISTAKGVALRQLIGSRLGHNIA
jgi:16S rRNA A1518/A1519 N6-dimethyltransferase RsmA/KsgA/DIM1 with predicted DNA glycosylase/AP lyase activity